LQTQKLSLFHKREYGKAGREIEHINYLLHRKAVPLLLNKRRIF
jgi:hypothetical protein